MGDVAKFYPADAAKDPDNVLELAIGEFSSVLILGWDKSGMLDARATLDVSKKDALWLLEVFKSKLLDGDYDDD